MVRRTAIIIGGGPGGLTAALELLERTDIHPVVFEAADDVGGIARTHVYKGNRIDLGGHRFFSKSDRVMDWWGRMLPVQGPARADPGSDRVEISYQNKSRWLSLPPDGPDPEQVDEVMLIRERKSRILWRGQLFRYPLSLNLETLGKLGIASTMRIGAGYLHSQLFPIRPERSLEDFFINRFGHELYGTFFRDYTEKVWGVSCGEISAEWGAQRIKGLSLRRALIHSVTSRLRPANSVAQKQVETSLIERFLYPKFGPGQMWQTVTKRIEALGGEVHFRTRVTSLRHADGRVAAVKLRDSNGHEREASGDLFFSTAPVRELIAGLEPIAPIEVRDVAQGLVYRDFITVGVLLDRLKLAGNATGRDLHEKMSDNWIYVQEPGVKVGRLQFFNNWSPYLVADPETVWVGMEYFCNEGDSLWSMPDEKLTAFAVAELAAIGVIDVAAVLDSVVLRVPKTYPAYFGRYDEFDVIRRFVDGLANLYLIGRNGMHRYNNQDHSMLAAMVAVDNIAAGRSDKDNIWSVNTETDYHEEK